MEDKLFKVALAMIGVGGACIAKLYGKQQYSKGVKDATKFYGKIIESNHKTIHDLLGKLIRQEGSQK